MNSYTDHLTPPPEPAVAAFLTNDRASIELVLGAIAAGGRLISLPLPSRSADLIAFGNFIKKTCIAHNVSSVVARDDIAALLDSIGLAVRPHSTLGTEAIAVPAPGGFELVQFSSGTTGRPAGIALSSEVLGVNVTAILEAVDPRPGDVTVSWLPLSHDMGLIGMLLTSVAACSPARVGSGNIVITEPESFLRSPGSWIVAIDKWGGSFTAAPDFGYRLAAQRRPAGAFDLSRLRCAIIGGEIIRYVFRTTPLRKLYAPMHEQIANQNRSISKVFKLEGVLEGHVRIGEEWGDMFLYSMGRESFEGLEAYVSSTRRPSPRRIGELS